MTLRSGRTLEIMRARQKLHDVSSSTTARFPVFCRSAISHLTSSKPSCKRQPLSLTVKRLLQGIACRWSEREWRRRGVRQDIDRRRPLPHAHSGSSNSNTLQPRRSHRGGSGRDARGRPAGAVPGGHSEGSLTSTYFEAEKTTSDARRREGRYLLRTRPEAAASISSGSNCQLSRLLKSPPTCLARKPPCSEGLWGVAPSNINHLSLLDS